MMIGYLEGRVLRQTPEGIILLAGHIGYDIMMDPVTLARAVSSDAGGEETVGLYIYYHVTERQPKPVLIGFLSPEDKEFFQLFITVAAVGPMKAAKALTEPVGEVARAIEEKNVPFLSKLPGIGKRTADKIIATLQGKVMEFADASVPEAAANETAQIPVEKENISTQVSEVLVEQLGHSAASARRMIREAFERDPSIRTPEDLFDEIYRENP